MTKKLSEEVSKELLEITRKFEEQYYKFVRDTSGESHLQIILRGHLYIEYELLTLLKKHLKHPQLIIGKLKFSDIVNLVFALGLLPIEYIKVFRRVNKLRNSFAHQLDFTLNEEDITRLLESFTPELQKSFHSFLKSKQDDDITSRLQTALFTIWCYVIEQNIIPPHIRELLDQRFSN
ncbi:hypothetical protein ACT91Q_15560 [Brevibacillus thermoruber]|uniref:hypothetical protein n=1 Tax=Brevibacillus thermoruber TaxID=33942 RepID=UPI0040415C64